MKKNLIFLMLLISVLMVSVVSASITGYLVRGGGGIADAGYTATLQKVEGTTAIVSVRTPTGDSELVRIAEGGTAQVGEAQISASGLTRGTLFTRSGANVEIDVNPQGAGTISGAGSSTGSRCIQDCSWEFTDSVVNPSNASGVGATAWCGSGEIAIQGSCFGDAAYLVDSSYVAGILQAPGAPGSGWTCQYSLQQDIVLGPSYTLETGALCCKI